MKNFQFFNWILCNLLVISCAYSDKIGNGKCKLRAKKCDKISFEQFDQNCSSVDSTKLLIKKNSTDKIVISDEHFPSNYNSYEDTLLKTIGGKISKLIVPFDASRSSKCSTKCKLHTKQFIDSLEKFDMWAFQMHDASAKIPAGMLNGNLNQYGDFDQCLNTMAPDNEFRGKYCLAYIQMTVPERSPKLQHLRKLIHSHDAFINDFNDPGHRVPRYSMINWALCVPSSCTHTDVENGVNEYLKTFANGTGLQYQLRVEQRMCQVKGTTSLDRNTKLAIAFFASIIAIALLSTLVDLCVDKPHDLLVAFSLWKNTKSLISLQRDANDISTIHGIRLFNAILLLVSHKSMALFFNAYTNRTGMIEALGDYISVVGRAAAIYTDVFLLLSGLLTSYSMIGRLQRNQSPRIIQDYLGRLLRILPTLGALILFCTYILPQIGSGPQWNLVVTTHSDICKENWWRNLLFIHNYFGFSKMCLTHTHHVGIDTQLFAIAPILIFLLWKWPRNGTIFLLTLAGASVIGRFYITVSEQLSDYVYFGASIKQLFRTADYMYIIPVYRVSIYIMGIFVGYAMRMHKNVKLTKTQLIYGWIISITVCFVALFGPAPMGNMKYIYNAYHAAVYASFSPIAWCILPVWIIFTTHLGYNTIVSDILSWKGFLISTRLSYAIYLTQFPVFFYNVGTMRHSGYYNFLATTINVYEFLFVLMFSIILTLLFDTPFQCIKKFLFNNSSIKSTVTSITYEEKSRKSIELTSRDIKDSVHKLD